ncbi:MAG: tetratricopeptide repeat protein [Hyphomonadaceae bacterium]|nr:tetratricopeptide repeat protein [Hyphomonadaceae bacterium]
MSLKRGAAFLCAAACLTACAQTDALAPSRSREYADFLIARVANMSGDFTVASQRYDAAVSQSADDPALVNGAIAAALSSGDVARARTLARMTPSSGEAPPLALLVRATDDLSRARYGAAMNELERMQSGPADALVARFLQSWVEVGDGDADSAAVALDQLSAMRPYGGLLAYQRALTLDYAGHDQEALEAYALAEQASFWLAPAVERHADLRARAGSVEEARAILNSAPSRNDSEALARDLERLNEEGRVAVTELTPARGAAIALFGLGAIFLQERDEARGLATLTLALMLDPDLDPARLSFAQAQAELGHFAEARAALAQVRRASPYYLGAQIMTAWVLKDEGREAEALALAQQVAAEGERGQRALADMYRSLDQYGEAEALYSQLIDGGLTQEWRLYYYRAATRERLGRWPEAEMDLQRALELSPEQPEVMNFLAYTWVDRGEYLQEALAMLRRAVEQRPSSAAIIDSLGWAYYRLGEYDKALEHLERAVELMPADATLNDHLGDLYWRLERYTEARFQWRRALAGEPEDVAAIEAKIERGLPPTRSATR